MTVYSATFTMVAGGITITFNARPSSVNFTKQAHIGVHNVPGGTGQTIVQNMGYGGYLIKFNCTIWNITSIAMTGVAALGDQWEIADQIMDWWINGTVITFTCDYLDEAEGGSITVKIIADPELLENPGHARDYDMKLTLQEYDAGSAI